MGAASPPAGRRHRIGQFGSDGESGAGDMDDVDEHSELKDLRAPQLDISMDRLDQAVSLSARDSRRRRKERKRGSSRRRMSQGVTSESGPHSRGAVDGTIDED